jgi:hypothetical protein
MQRHLTQFRVASKRVHKSHFRSLCNVTLHVHNLTLHHCACNITPQDAHRLRQQLVSSVAVRSAVSHSVVYWYVKATCIFLFFFCFLFFSASV